MKKACGIKGPNDEIRVLSTFPYLSLACPQARLETGMNWQGIKPSSYSPPPARPIGNQSNQVELYTMVGQIKT